ncbi:MAG: pyridoxal phosphate-dependent aminotransferase [Myxococcota bacterium]
MFSRRTSFDRTPHPLARALAEARARGRPLLDLTESNPTRVALPYDEEAIRRALAEGSVTQYEPQPLGLPAARRAVAAHIGAEPVRLLLTASTSEAYAHLFALLCDPGDEVLVPQPSYPLLEHLTRLQSVQPVPYPLEYDGEWHVDIDGLKRGRTVRTRAIVAVHPNNPTGSFVKRDELGAMADLGLPIVSDEVFAAYAFDDDPRRARSALEATEALVFVLGGLSKLAGLPQMKLGWMTIGGPSARIREATERLEHIADSFLSVGTPVQNAAAGLLEQGAVTQRAIRARTRRNLRALQRTFDGDSAATVLRVEGGWYAVVRVPATLDETEWTLALLDAGVVVHPGWFYDFSAPAYLVLSLLPLEATFDAGIDRLARVVRAHS